MNLFKTLLGPLTLAAASGAALAEDSDLLVFDYSGFEIAAFHGKYVEKHGSSPRFAFFADEDEAFQKLRTGFKADVAHICGDSVTKWVDSGLIEPWDTTRITALGDLNRDLTGTDLTGDVKDIYFLPSDYGSTAVAYNPDLVPAEDAASLQIFLNPAYAGRITLPDVTADSYALAYLATGTTDWTTATDAQFQAATDWLRKVHPNVRTYWTDPAELAQLLASGEIAVSWAWNETLPTMVAQGHPIAFQREPSEGSSLWLCGQVKLKDGEGVEDKVYDYVNALLDPSATTALLDAGYGHSNAKAMADKGEEALKAAGLGRISAPVLPQLPQSQALREKQNAEFEKIKAGF